MNEAQKEYDTVLKNIEMLKIKRKTLVEAHKAPDKILEEIVLIDKRLIDLGEKLRRAFAKVTRITRAEHHE